MPKKLVKKRKLKLFNFFLMLLILGSVSFSVYLYLQIPIQNIIIKNTNYLNDDYILELANIKDYPKYYEKSNRKIKNALEKSTYIEKAKVKSRFFHILEIEVSENKALFYRDTDKKIVFKDGKSIEEEQEFIIFRVPRLLNEIPDSLLEEFIKSMNNIDDNTLSRISEILYDPNDIDKERFLLYMDDGNMVYVTLTKFKKINYYNSVLEQLENRKGIIYLDNGNYFEIKE